MDPNNGFANVNEPVVLAHLTVPSGVSLEGTVSLQGRSVGGYGDWMARSIHFAASGHCKTTNAYDDEVGPGACEELLAARVLTCASDFSLGGVYSGL